MWGESAKGPGTEELSWRSWRMYRRRVKATHILDQRERWPDVIQSLARNVVHHNDRSAFFLFEEPPPYTRNRDCGVRSNELDRRGFKMKFTYIPGGLYEGIIADLSNTERVRFHAFGIVKAPQDFCIIPLVRLDGLRQSTRSAKIGGESGLRTLSSSFLSKGRAQHSTSSRVSNIVISVL